MSDQGALISENYGRTWTTWYNQPTAQLYHVVADNGVPYRVCAGQQDSGSLCLSSRGNDGEITFRDWHPVGVIEYGYAVPDPLNPDIIYGAGRSDVTKYDWITGQVQKITPIALTSPKYRTDRTQPLIFSPKDPHIIYFAANYVFKTVDGGHSWQTISPDLTREHPGLPASVGEMAKNTPGADAHRGVIYALAPSFNDVNTIWAGTDDGNIQVTRDGGKTWKNVTPAGLEPWSKVTQLVASRFDEQTAYASVSRFRVDDLHPYVYRTHDGGKTWQLIVSGIADHAAVDSVREDPVRKHLLFAGTENAVWVSFDDGDHWQSLQLNLPHTSMRDLWIHDHDLIVATHGRGFWILDDITPLEQLTDAAEKSDAYLYKPESAYRYRRDTNTDTPLPPETPAGENPPDGAIINYSLGHAPSGPVTLEIFDATGKLVRRVASTDKPEFDQSELERTLGVPTYWVRPPHVLSAEPGMHRWVWDIHYAPLATERHDYPISAVPHDTPREPLGPRAVPGTYTVKLTVDGHTFSAPLIIKKDPRVKATQPDLVLEASAELRIADAMSKGSETIEKVHALQADLKKLSGQANGAVADAITALDKQAAAVAGQAGGGFGGGGGGGAGAGAAAAMTLARLDDEFGTLFASVDSADAAPTMPQNEALQELNTEFTKLMAAWTKLKTQDVPALNQQLQKAGLPAIEVK